MGSNEIIPLNLKITTIKVDAEVREIKTKFRIITLPPDFGMSDGARKEFGLSNPIKYWWWRRQMKNKWKKKYKNNGNLEKK